MLRQKLEWKEKTGNEAFETSNRVTKKTKSRTSSILIGALTGLFYTCLLRLECSLLDIFRHSKISRMSLHPSLRPR